MNTLLFVIITYCSNIYGSAMGNVHQKQCVSKIIECSSSQYVGVNEIALERCLIKEGK